MNTASSPGIGGELGKKEQLSLPIQFSIHHCLRHLDGIGRRIRVPTGVRLCGFLFAVSSVGARYSRGPRLSFIASRHRKQRRILVVHARKHRVVREPRLKMRWSVGWS